MGSIAFKAQRPFTQARMNNLNLALWSQLHKRRTQTTGREGQQPKKCQEVSEAGALLVGVIITVEEPTSCDHHYSVQVHNQGQNQFYDDETCSEIHHSIHKSVVICWCTVRGGTFFKLADAHVSLGHRRQRSALRSSS